MKKIITLSTVVASCLPIASYAHEGHFGPHDPVMHYLTSPAHVVPALLVVMGMAVAGWAWKRAKKTAK
ncbi:MAG: hypothetical protein GY705_23760 [Bacteroidetes bacterium]|nr:hypothetical protein [Bacteroidota bacterium]